MTWVVEPLDATHLRDSFDCGQQTLDDYIRKYAGQHARRNFGRTFVAVSPGSKQVSAYYTLSSSSVAFEHAPASLQRKLPRYPLPAALLARLAVDRTTQGCGLGQSLLIDAFRRIVEASESMAIFAVEVHAIDTQAAAFYTRYGFQPFQDRPTHLYLPLATVKKLF